MPSTLPFLLHVSQEPFEAEKALAVASLVNSYGAQLLKQLSLNNVYEGFDNDPFKGLEFRIRHLWFIFSFKI